MKSPNSNENSESSWEEPKKPLHEEVKKEKNTTASTKLQINRVIDSNVTTTLMSIITIYALYGDDVRILAFEPSADTTFLVLSTLAFSCFFIEIVLLCWCKEQYLQKPDFDAITELCTLACWKRRKSTFSWLGEFRKAVQAGSFYFWLDLISTFSMAIEVCLFLFIRLV